MGGVTSSIQCEMLIQEPFDASSPFAVVLLVTAARSCKAESTTRAFCSGQPILSLPCTNDAISATLADGSFAAAVRGGFGRSVPRRVPCSGRNDVVEMTVRVDAATVPLGSMIRGTGGDSATASLDRASISSWLHALLTAIQEFNTTTSDVQSGFFSVAVRNVELDDCRLGDAVGSWCAQALVGAHLAEPSRSGLGLLTRISLRCNELTVVGISRVLRTLLETRHHNGAAVLLLSSIAEIDLSGNDCSGATCRVVENYCSRIGELFIRIDEMEKVRTEDCNLMGGDDTNLEAERDVGPCSERASSSASPQEIIWAGERNPVETATALNSPFSSLPTSTSFVEGGPHLTTPSHQQQLEQDELLVQESIQRCMLLSRHLREAAHLRPFGRVAHSTDTAVSSFEALMLEEVSSRIEAQCTAGRLLRDHLVKAILATTASSTGSAASTSLMKVQSVAVALYEEDKFQCIDGLRVVVLQKVFDAAVSLLTATNASEEATTGKSVSAICLAAGLKAIHIGLTAIFESEYCTMAAAAIFREAGGVVLKDKAENCFSSVDHSPAAMEIAVGSKPENCGESSLTSQTQQKPKVGKYSHVKSKIETFRSPVRHETGHAVAEDYTPKDTKPTMCPNKTLPCNNKEESVASALSPRKQESKLQRHQHRAMKIGETASSSLRRAAALEAKLKALVEHQKEQAIIAKMSVKIRHHRQDVSSDDEDPPRRGKPKPIAEKEGNGGAGQAASSHQEPNEQPLTTGSAAVNDATEFDTRHLSNKIANGLETSPCAEQRQLQKPFYLMPKAKAPPLFTIHKPSGGTCEGDEEDDDAVGHSRSTVPVPIPVESHIDDLRHRLATTDEGERMAQTEIAPMRSASALSTTSATTSGARRESSASYFSRQSLSSMSSQPPPLPVACPPFAAATAEATTVQEQPQPMGKIVSSRKRQVKSRLCSNQPTSLQADRDHQQQQQQSSRLSSLLFPPSSTSNASMTTGVRGATPTPIVTDVVFSNMLHLLGSQAAPTSTRKAAPIGGAELVTCAAAPTTSHRHIDPKGKKASTSAPTNFYEDVVTGDGGISCGRQLSSSRSSGATLLSTERSKSSSAASSGIDQDGTLHCGGPLLQALQHVTVSSQFGHRN